MLIEVSVESFGTITFTPWVGPMNTPASAASVSPSNNASVPPVVAKSTARPSSRVVGGAGRRGTGHVSRGRAKYLKGRAVVPPVPFLNDW